MSKQNPRLYAEHLAREKFQRKLEQLRFELRIESPRRVLDYLLEHADDLLRSCGQESELIRSFRGQLDAARRDVAQRHNLRIVNWAAKPAIMLDRVRRSSTTEPPKGAA
jgi:hypothetical protein